MADFGYTRNDDEFALMLAGCDRIFIEDFTDDFHQVELLACLAAMEAGDTLVVVSLLEVSRSAAAILDVVEWLDQHGQFLRDVTSGTDTSKLVDRALLRIRLSAVIDWPGTP